MSNIPGTSGLVPGVYAETITQSKGVSVPSFGRLAAILGEGSRAETLVTAALGGGNDGLNPLYTNASGADGRHFKLSLFPIISNRTSLFRNGIPLVGLEAKIDSNAFDSAYDYRIDIATGKIELQRAYLADQGGTFYGTGTQNFGSGTVQNLTIVDLNAPSETWTIKCTSVQRDGYGIPITKTAKFLSFGTVSGSKLDGYGNPIVWLSDNNVVSNGTLSFSILQNPLLGSNNLKEGDNFTVKIKSGVLLKNDSLTASYIGVADINDPTFFASMNDITLKHGSPSVDNNLSLGSLIAFANSTPGVLTLQTMPAIPRRTNLALSKAVLSNSTNIEDLIFPLPVNVTPDVNSSIHFFITNPATGIETQVLPNKYSLFSLTDASTGPSIKDFTSSASTYSYFYTAIQRPLVNKLSSDGAITAQLSSPGNAVLASNSFLFSASDVGKKIKIFDTVNPTNTGTFDVVSDTNGQLGIRNSLFVAETALTVTFKTAGGTTIATVSDGYIVPDLIDGTKAVLGSVLTDFSLIASLSTLNPIITIASNAPNNGTFINTGVVLGNNHTITIKKFFVTESPVTFEVYDPNSVGSFIVLNNAVVPAGFALRATLIDKRDATFYDAGWLTALSVLETTDVDIVCPLPKQTISAIFQNTVSHCRTMSNVANRRERVAFVGAINGLTADNVLGNKSAAVEDIGVLEGIQGSNISDILAGNTEDLTNYDVQAAFGNTYRSVYFYPDQIVVQAGTSNILIDGFYMTPAAAGYFCSVPSVAMPLTNKVLTGFTILKNRRFSPSVLKALVGHGMTVVQPVTGGGLVIQGQTTTLSGFPEEQEISIIFIRDRIAKTMRGGFAGFIGQPEDDSTLASLTSRATGLLGSFVGSLITAFDSLKIARDLVDPRQWNVSVRCQPVYGINWIYIRVSVGIL